MNIPDEAVEAAQPDTKTKGTQMVPEKAIEAAARAHYETYLGREWDALDPVMRATNAERMRIALEAAAPHLMAATAEPGSAMHEAMHLAWNQGFDMGWGAARGEPEEPNPYRRSAGAGE